MDLRYWLGSYLPADHAAAHDSLHYPPLPSIVKRRDNQADTNIGPACMRHKCSAMVKSPVVLWFPGKSMVWRSPNGNLPLWSLTPKCSNPHSSKNGFNGRILLFGDNPFPFYRLQISSWNEDPWAIHHQISSERLSSDKEKILLLFPSLLFLALLTKRRIHDVTHTMWL